MSIFKEAPEINFKPSRFDLSDWNNPMFAGQSEGQIATQLGIANPYLPAYGMEGDVVFGGDGGRLDRTKPASFYHDAYADLLKAYTTNQDGSLKPGLEKFKWSQPVRGGPVDVYNIGEGSQDTMFGKSMDFWGNLLGTLPVAAMTGGLTATMGEGLAGASALEGSIAAGQAGAVGAGGVLGSAGAVPAGFGAAAGGNSLTQWLQNLGINPSSIPNPISGTQDASWGVNPQGGSMDWLDELMQNFNPDLGFQGLNEAGSGLQGGMVPNNWSSIDQLIQNLGSGAGEAENLGTAQSVTSQSSWLQNLIRQMPNMPPGTQQALKAALSGSGAGGGSLLGGLLGAIAGGVGAQSKPAGVTTTVNDIPDWLKPYVIGNLNGAAGVRNDLAGNTSVMDAATPEYLKTVNGAYLDPATNPYLDATFKHASGLVGAGVDSRFESAGRYGSGAHQSTLQEGFNNLATSIYGGNYQAERARQAAATGGAPTYVTGASGAAYSPYSGLNSLFPNVRATSEPYFSNTGGGILSGALAGSQLSKLFA